MALKTNYGAPMTIYAHLATGQTNDEVMVCLGKEWYRFPGHYFLPDGMRVGFLRSAFRGLLPKYFEGSGRNGTMIIPTTMNDVNREEVDRYVDPTQCSYIIDLHLPHVVESSEEPDYTAMHREWERVACTQFLDAGRSGRLVRAFWVPEAVRGFVKGQKLVWGDYCLLKRVG
ncbi:mannosyltransferase [Dinochytrium kinnereticum]|nr:mannosyltransferase [Dinochytrium kinnereticum]